MSSAQFPKLTKKQKKGIAFRERKQGRSDRKNGRLASDQDGQEVPVQEAVDQIEIQDGDVEMEETAAKEGSRKADTKGKGKGKGVAVRGDTKVVQSAAKRKREEGEKHEGEKPTQKKIKRDPADDSKAETVEKGTKKQVKQRFILFVGNLKYTTSQDTIKEHFAACDPPPTIRLLTPKLSATGKPTVKSKGCAFLEFSHRNALQQALKLHQSEIEGRRINVELTAGGGGKSESRLSKVKERNKELDGQRKKRQEKHATPGKDEEQASMLPERPQRFSTTSGMEQSSAGKRTWTVGDEENGETHRGGRKHSRTGKKGRPKGKEWGTGVNAIPVG